MIGVLAAKAAGWLIGSRAGVLVLGFGVAAAALYAWHLFDKSSAVRAAVVGFVADVELAAAEAELANLKTRAEALEAANFSFQRQMQEAEAIQTRQALELDTYVSTVDAVVDGALLERLSNN